jgi:hypothetical protein
VRWADVVAIVRRWWWVLVVVTLLIGGLSVIRWWRTPPTYDATHTVSIAILPAGMPSGQQSYLAEQQALAIARVVVSPGFLTAPAFNKALAHVLSTAPDQSLRQASPLTLGRALSASHSGSIISFTASWGSATGAEALARAAGAVLAQDNPEINALLGGGDTPRFFITTDASPAVRDAVADAAARDALLMRLALGVLAGLLVMATLGLLEWRQAGNGGLWQADMQGTE